MNTPRTEELAWPAAMARKDKIIERQERRETELQSRVDFLNEQNSALQERHDDLLAALVIADEALQQKKVYIGAVKKAIAKAGAA